LKSLFVDNGALNRMQRSIGARQALDRQNASGAYGVGQHGARVAGDVVDEDSARAALRAIASEFRTGEAQLVAQRPRQRFLLAHVDPPLLPIDVKSEQPLAHAGLCEQARNELGAAEQIGGGKGAGPTANDALDERASRYIGRRLYRLVALDVVVHACCLCCQHLWSVR
jgi:hypothetical protein